MENKKGFKYYVRYYLILLLAYVVLVLISTSMNDWVWNTGQLISIAYLPLTFVVFMFIFDRIFAKFMKPKKTSDKDQYSLFVRKVVEELQEKENFIIEDYNQLRENDRFQKAMKHAYEIAENGETEEMNVEFLRKKFKKDTVERKAMDIVLEEVNTRLNS